MELADPWKYLNCINVYLLSIQAYEQGSLTQQAYL